MPLISLRNSDYQVLVDESSTDLLSQYKWRAMTRTYKGKKWVYAVSQLPGRGIVLMHRLLASAKRGAFVDHVNGNTLDNRAENLRVCTHADNMRNRDGSRFSSSGLKGVHKSGNRWRARIYCNGEPHHLGTFDDAAAAAKAYQEAAGRLHKEFARW